MAVLRTAARVYSEDKSNFGRGTELMSCIKSRWMGGVEVRSSDKGYKADERLRAGRLRCEVIGRPRLMTTCIRRSIANFGDRTMTVFPMYFLTAVSSFCCVAGRLQRAIFDPSPSDNRHSAR